LETLRDTANPGSGKRIAVLGEMRELGAYADEGHATVGRAAARTVPDMLILVGPLTVRIAAAARVAGFPEDRIHYFATTEEAVGVVPSIVQAGDIVLVKGSRAMAMERIVERLP
jgi:UDP-N-acetylmuramoyl-tripeptide--D-alanyl-D-alanine ligase